MNKNKKWFLSFALTLIFGLILPPVLQARDITYTPKINLSGEYNDNIFFSRTDKEDDFILNVAPALEVEYAGQLFDLYSFATVRFRNYASESDLDREDYYVNLRGRYRLTERLQFRGRFYYVQDFTLESKTIDLEDPIEDPIIDGIPVEEPDEAERGIERFLSERKRYNAFASMNYRLTEVSNLDVGYRYLKTNYDLEENTNYEVNSLNLAYMRRLAGQRDRVGTRLSYILRTSDISDTDSYGAGLIWNHFFTETITLYTDLGVRYTEQTFKNTNQKRDNWNATANIRLRKRGETSIMLIGLRQNLQTTSGGRSVNVSRLYWDLRQVISERFRFELEGDFYITREDSSSLFDSDTVFFDIIPSVRYMLTENHSVKLAYNYTIDHDRTLDKDRDKERNRVWIAFDFGFPKKW